MSPPETLLILSAVGAACGAVNAWGLWHTSLAVPHVRRPGLLVLGSFVLRTLATLTPVVLLGDGQADRLIAGLASFLMVRLLAVHVISVRPRPRLPRRKLSP